MTNSKIIDINFLEKKLGLFPVPIFHSDKNQNPYVLLNGSLGSFCADINGEYEERGRILAWSSDVKHYLSVLDDVVKVYRWDKLNSETYSITSIEDKIHNFYDYLIKDQIKNNISVIFFVIQFYRKIRNLLKDKIGRDSLNALLVLFAAELSKQDPDKVNIENWSLSESTKDVVNKISNSNWDYLLKELRGGVPALDLKPDINLILRHASGSLFQEAHFETLFSNQMLLPFDNFQLVESKVREVHPAGVYYTPSVLVRTIVEEAIKTIGTLPSKLKIFDPACGSGEFLKEFLRQLKIRNYNGDIEIIGWDISSAAVDITNFVLAFEKQIFQQSVICRIECKDSLSPSSVWPTDIDFVLMNPPFISWESMSGSQKDYVQNIMGSLYSARPNSAGAFFWKAINSLKENGIIGTILPASILEADSFDSLRKKVIEILSIKFIGKLGSLNLFSDAIVDTSIFVAQKIVNQTNEPTIFLWCDNQLQSVSSAIREFRKSRFDLISKDFPFEQKNFSFYPISDLYNKKTWTPISYTSYKLLNELGSFPKAEELFEIKQGVRTGFNKAFIIKADFWKKLKKIEKKFFRPVIINESIVNGFIQNVAYIFYPYGELGNLIQTEKDLKHYVSTYYNEILSKYKQALTKRAEKNVKNWWTLTRPRGWQLKKVQKIVSTEFGKAGSFSVDDDGEFIVERGHAWFLRQVESSYDLSDLYYGYVAILNSDFINSLLEAVSKKISGGQWYLSSKFLNNLPLPNLSRMNDKALFEEISNIGYCLVKNKGVDKSSLNLITEQVYSTGI